MLQVRRCCIGLGLSIILLRERELVSIRRCYVEVSAIALLLYSYKHCLSVFPLHKLHEPRLCTIIIGNVYTIHI